MSSKKRWESHPPTHDRSSSKDSITSNEAYEERKRRASQVWFSGLFSGERHVPQPKSVDINMSEEEREELLKERTYTVPCGNKYYTRELPDILNPRPTGILCKALIAYLVLAFLSFILLLASSCPIPWYRGKDVTVDGVNYNKVQFTLWKQKGGDLPTISTRSLTCPIEKQFYQTIAAATIIACIFCLFSIMTGLLRLGGHGSYGWTILFAFLSFIWAITGNSMSLSHFHLSRCNKPRFSNIAHLNAGFILTLLAWFFLLVGFIVLFVATRLNIAPALKSIRVMDSIYMALLLISLLFTVVANATTIWKRRFNTDMVRLVRVSYWNTELIMGNGTNIYYGRRHYRCPAYTKRIKASVAFLMLGSIALFLAAVFGISAFLRRRPRFVSCIFTILASIFLFVSWVTAVATFYRTLCKETTSNTVYRDYPGVPSGRKNGYTKFTGYGIQEGVVLVIVAWILSTGAVILNYLVPWPPNRRGMMTMAKSQ